VWSFVVLFLSCVVWYYSYHVFGCVTCFSSYRRFISHEHTSSYAQGTGTLASAPAPLRLLEHSALRHPASPAATPVTFSHYDPLVFLSFFSSRLIITVPIHSLVLAQTAAALA